MDQFRTVTYFLLRVVSGFLFMHHGGQKLFGWFGGMPGGATAQVFTQPWIGGVIELIGGALLTLGLFTRPVAFILSGETAVAYFHDHAPQSFFPVVNDGGLAMLFCFTFFYIAFAGGGPVEAPKQAELARIYQDELIDAEKALAAYRRLREDPTVENGLSFWCVSDNLRKGAALNAVQIAEVLINRRLITAKQKAA